MTLRHIVHRVTDVAWLNVVLTNFIPRRTLTRAVGRLARSEHPLVVAASMRIWRLFCDLDLSEAKTDQFKSLRDCFIRELKPGARPVDRTPDVVVSPCDAIVGACGTIEDGVMLQVKGSSYLLEDLVQAPDFVAAYRHGTYVTLRLTASMYHRFHAPHDGRITSVAHISGDTWNVNPPTLERIPRVFCRNERAVIRLDLSGDRALVLVPVAAILVAGLHLTFTDMPGDRFHREPWVRACDQAVTKGQELGWFEHGSTIIVLAPAGFRLAEGISTGRETRMGRPLLTMPS
jgi:phosphatidylserine decarboxylase